MSQKLCGKPLYPYHDTERNNFGPSHACNMFTLALLHQQDDCAVYALFSDGRQMLRPYQKASYSPSVATVARPGWQHVSLTTFEGGGKPFALKWALLNNSPVLYSFDQWRRCANTTLAPPCRRMFFVNMWMETWTKSTTRFCQNISIRAGLLEVHSSAQVKAQHHLLETVYSEIVNDRFGERFEGSLKKGWMRRTSSYRANTRATTAVMETFYTLT